MTKILRAALIPAALGVGLLLSASPASAQMHSRGSFRGGSRGGFHSGRAHVSAPRHGFASGRFGGGRHFAAPRHSFAAPRRGFAGSGRGFFAPRRRVFFRAGAFVPFGFRPRFFPDFGFGFFAPASDCGFDGFVDDCFVPVRRFGARFVVSGRPFFFSHGRRFFGRR